MDLTRVVKRSRYLSVQVKFLIQEQRLDVDDADIKLLNDAGVHNEMRKMLAALDLTKSCLLNNLKKISQ